MAANLVNSETICDVKGAPLQPGAVAFLKALDRLLTVGAYYSAEHDQYLKAAMKARDAIVAAIGGPTRTMAIEVTTLGLMISGQNVDPHHRNVRLLHDLLVPLNIARLEIDGGLSPEDLRQALAALHEHKLALGKARSFQEVVIENLPTTVRAISRSVLRQSSDEIPLDDLLGQWGDQDAGAGNDEQAGSNELEKLAREFLEMVNHILANLAEMERTRGAQLQDVETGAYVTREELLNLKKALERLVEVNPDPADLLALIAHARRALDLSRDPGSVNLAFEILKKDMAATAKDKAAGKGANKGAKSGPVTYQMTVDQMLSRAAELAQSGGEFPDPLTSAQANQLGICLLLLRSDPPRSLRGALIETIAAAVSRPTFVAADLAVCAAAVCDVLRQDNTDGIDDLLPLVTGTLRARRPSALVRFWTLVLAEVGDRHRAELWPHLVNDILLGFENAPRDKIIPLVLAAGELDDRTAVGQGRRLERQPALQGQRAALDLFLAPLDRIHSVLALLMASPLKTWVGWELFRALQARPVSPLVEVVMKALGEHQPQHTVLYLDLVANGTRSPVPPGLSEPVSQLLHGVLTTLPAERRREEWVPQGLTALLELNRELGGPVLAQVLGERRLLFFKAWPAPAREAAARALVERNGEVA